MASYQKITKFRSDKNLKEIDTITRDKLAPIFFPLSWIKNAIVDWVSQIIREILSASSQGDFTRESLYKNDVSLEGDSLEKWDRCIAYRWISRGKGIIERTKRRVARHLVYI